MNQRIAGAWGRVSLRAKLTALSVGLIGLLLLVSSAGTIALLRTYLQQNTDTLLTATAASLRNENPATLELRVASGRLTLPSLPSDYFIALLDGDGDQRLGLVSATGGSRQVPNFSSLSLDVVLATRGVPFDIEVENNAGGSTSWRIVAQPLTQALGSIVVALPTEGNRQIINEYADIGGRFGIFLLMVSGLSIWITISSALRPLEEVERTAKAVRAGDFSKRLAERSSKTEIGRLNHSLNSMLDGIESAFKGRDKTLEQMRRFVSDASHELRTPLVTVRGYAELYRMGGIRKSSEVREAMARIESEAVRMSGLVESLLTLTRIDEMASLEREKVNLVELAETAQKDAAVAHPGLKFEVTDLSGKPLASAAGDAGGAITVNCDRDKLRQVLTNLLDNAGRFAPKGSLVSVQIGQTAGPAKTAAGKTAGVVKTAAVSKAAAVGKAASVGKSSVAGKPAKSPVVTAEDTGRVTLRVVDHGEGIPAPLRDKVFDRFYRADTSRNRETGGSGLGLAIVKSIVGVHGGTIRVEETPGGGATFVVELPSTASPTKA